MYLIIESFVFFSLFFSKPLLNQNQPPDIDEYNLRRYPHSRQQQQSYMNLDESVPQQHYYPEMKSKAFLSQNGDGNLYNNDDLIRASIVNQLPKKLG